MEGMIFNIQHYSIHDGPGIRTVVFLKGCRMRCPWCANPESQNMTFELSYQRHKCIGEPCGLCLNACSENAVSFIDDRIAVDRKKCIKCQECVSICPSGALEMFGYFRDVNSIIDEVEADELFYTRSKGGITLSGGEVCLQSEFACALLNESKSRGINTAIETCGYAPWKDVERVISYCDYILFDIKHLNEKKHQQYTTVSNSLILDNFKKIAKVFPQKNITVRTPVIPGFNDTKTEIGAIEEFLLENAPEVNYELLKYHRFGESKYTCLGREYGMHDVELSDHKFDYLKHNLTITGAIK